MPVYAYACKDCGHAFDIRQSFSESALTVCPECEGGLRKKFNTVGVVFKGSGFYRNDSRGTGSTGTDTSGTSSSGTGSRGGGDSGDSSSSAAPAAPAPATAAAGASSSAGAPAGGSSD